MKKKETLSIFFIIVVTSFLILTSCIEPPIFGPEINVKQGSVNLANGSGIYDFGNVLPDGEGDTTSGYVLFEIENKGDSDLTISSVTINLGDIEVFDLIDSTIPTLPASTTTSFTISFDPVETGLKEATVTIANNDKDESTYTFSILGNGCIPYVNTEQRISAFDAHTGDCFSYAVASDGDYAIVGAHGKDGYAGAAYIFHRTGPDSWDSGTKIFAPDAAVEDYFGYSVGISGDYVIVGAYNEDGEPGNFIINAGAAYIFHRTGTNVWDFDMKITADDAQAEDHFGYSVGISGDYAIAGASYKDGGAGSTITDAGAVYIFHRTGTTTWDFDMKITADDAQSNDRFGHAAAISGDYIIVGAYCEDGSSGDPVFNAGAAYIFHRTETNIWDLGFKIAATIPQNGAYFGYSVGINGDYAIVGAHGEDGGYTDTGAAYTFHRKGQNIWEPGDRITTTDLRANDNFGRSVGIRGDYAIVGAHYGDGGTGNTIPDTGAAYIFHRTGTTTWDSGKKITADNPQTDARFGISAAMGRDYAIVGAYLEDGEAEDAGAAHIFE